MSDKDQEHKEEPVADQDPDPLDIPEFLRAKEGTPAERTAAWDAAFAKTGRQPAAPPASMLTPKVMDESTLLFMEQQAEEKRLRTAARIAKMKAKLHPLKIHPTNHAWDIHRFRPCWVWSGTNEPVRFNPDGTARPRVPPAPPGATTKEPAPMLSQSPTTKPAKGKEPAGKQAKPAKGKAKAKRPLAETLTTKAVATAIAKGGKKSKADVDAALTAATEKAKAKGSRTSGVITAAVEYIKRPEGASVDEIMKHIATTFPGVTPNKTTCRVYPSKAATRREKIEGRGIVYFNETKPAAKSAG